MSLETMSLETQLYAALNVAGVTALVGIRIYPDVVPLEKGLPAISYGRLSTDFYPVLDSSIAAARGGFEVWCMGDTRTAADALTDAVAAAIAAAKWIATGRRHEFDFDHKTYSTVFTVDVWE